MSSRQGRLATVAAGLLLVALSAAGPAGAALRLETQWGSEGTAPGQFGTGNEMSRQSSRQFDDPAGIAVDRQNRVLVADSSNNRVERYTRRGRYVSDRCNQRVEHFSAGGQFIGVLGRGVTDAPTFLTFDRAGNLFVADNHRVVEFAPGATSASLMPVAGAAHHNGVDLLCRHVADQVG